MPLGAATKVVRKRSPWRLQFDIQFPEEGTYPFADMILSLYNQGIINASSVGFIPLEWEPIEEKDEETGEKFRRGRKYLKQELLELSGVPVPSNPNAIQDFVKGLQMEDRDKELAYDYLMGNTKLSIPVDLEMEVIKYIDKIKSDVEYEEDSDIQIQVPDDLESSEEKGNVKIMTDDKESIDSVLKKIGGSKTLPTDNRATWDVSKADQNVRKWAGGPDKDKIDWKKYQKAHVWFNPDKADSYGGYKLLFADIINGKLTATWGGVRAAMASVLGARGGVNIPEADRKQAHGFLSAYYKKFEKPIPEYHDFDESEIKTIDILLDEERDLLEEEIRMAQPISSNEEGLGEQDLVPDEEETKESNVYESIVSSYDDVIVPSGKPARSNPLVGQLVKQTELIKQLKRLADSLDRLI